MDNTDVAYINQYYGLLGKIPIYCPSAGSVFSALLSGKNNVLISDNRIVRAVGRCKHLERPHPDEIRERALRHFALQDAFVLLAQKEVPVYFYNRIGKEKTGYQYTENELRRMRDGLTFPVMYQDIEQYTEDLKEIFGKRFSREYVEELGKIPQVIRIGSTYQHEDHHSRFVNVENGKRITQYQPESYKRTIHVYGRCGAFGYAVEDKETIPSLLQKKLLEEGVADIRVVNHGLWGSIDEYLDHNFLQEAVEMKKGDIVLFYRKHFDKRLLAEFVKRGVIYKEITHEWHERKSPEVTFYNQPGHMNAEGYQLVADLICEDLIANDFRLGNVDASIRNGGARDLNYYLKSNLNHDFESEINEYTETINKEYPIAGHMTNNGAIVMNCNPFTLGHRFLIETAAKQVDRLYIFVVEEDKSFFKYQDRYEMVKRGTADLGNIVVVPSGKFIISAYTFPEYFMKDYVKEKNFDVSMDVETFCRHIAPRLNIKVRFAGEEPFDPVTKNYNESMERILPRYNMTFVEVPRCALSGDRIINATQVRELLAKRNFEELKEYVPQSTYEVLMERYVE